MGVDKLAHKCSSKKSGKCVLYSGEKKCDDGYNDSEFIKRQREMIKDTKSQIVLICDIYISMRSNRIYKKPYNHSTAIQYMNNHFLDYFDGDIFSNFIRFSSDFDKIYSE